MNDSPFDSAYKSRLSAWEDLVVGVYLLLIGILALGLNTLVIYTCLKHWRSLVLSDYYILSLACSDVILPLSSFPLAIISSLYHGWMFGDTGCKMYGFFGFFLGIGSITTVTVMGIMRYISICKPHIKITSRRCIIASTIFPYFYAFAWSFLRLKWFGSYRLEWDGTSCTVNGDGYRSFNVLMSIFCICIPLSVILFAYWQIIFRYRKSTRNLRKHVSRNRKKAKKDSFLMKITFVMFWSFVLSWMPYMIASFHSVYAMDGNQSSRFAVFAALMSRTSTVLNPIIYFLMSKKFRPLLKNSCTFHKSHFFSLRRWDEIHSWKTITELLNRHNGVISFSAISKLEKKSSSGKRNVEILTGVIESVKL